MGLFDIFTGSSSKKARNEQIGAINQGKTEGLGYLDSGQTNAAGAFNKAAGLYDPYVQSGYKSNQLYSDALGLNGAEGNKNAQSAFQTSPGYQFGLDQGEQSLLRHQSAIGGLQSGNTSVDLTKYAQGYADQNYGSWMDRLQGLSSQGLSATSGQAGSLGSLGNLYSNTGAQKANVATGAATQTANAWGDWATAQNAASGNIWGGVLGGVKLFTGLGK